MTDVRRERIPLLSTIKNSNESMHARLLSTPASRVRQRDQ